MATQTKKSIKKATRPAVKPIKEEIAFIIEDNKEVITIEDVKIQEEVVKEEIKKTEPKEDKVYKNMDIGGTMVRVGDSVVINALPFEKNPFEVISNEEVLSRDGKTYAIDMLQKHSFRVANDQTKPPKYKNQGIIKLARSNSVMPNTGEIKVNENDIEFIN